MGNRLRPPVPDFPMPSAGVVSTIGRRRRPEAVTRRTEVALDNSRTPALGRVRLLKEAVRCGEDPLGLKVDTAVMPAGRP